MPRFDRHLSLARVTGDLFAVHTLVKLAYEQGVKFGNVGIGRNQVAGIIAAYKSTQRGLAQMVSVVSADANVARCGFAE